MKMVQLSNNPPFFLLEWFLFLILAVTSGFFMKEVILNYFSKATSFKIYDEEIEELPSITVCPDPAQNSLQYGKDFEIFYGKSNITLVEGTNDIKFNDFEESVILEKLTTYQFGTCYMISTNKDHNQFNAEGGFEIFYLSYADHIQHDKFPTAKIFIASKQNSYGTANSYWAEGDVMKFDIDKNTYKVGIQLDIAKEIYLIEKGLCQEESFQNCLGAELAKQDYSSCLKECVAYSLPNKDLPICETTEEMLCSLELIQSIFQEIATKRICKKSCTTFDIFGEVAVIAINKSEIFHYKTIYYTIAPPYLVKVSEEYIIYDIIGMVASIGGTLGLFVGFSFTNVTSFLVEVLKKFMKNGEQCKTRGIVFTEDMHQQLKESQQEIKVLKLKIKDMQDKNYMFDLISQNID